MVASIAINYIDHGTLSIAAVAVSGELNSTHAGSLVMAGWLIDRFNVIAVLARVF